MVKLLKLIDRKEKEEEKMGMKIVEIFCFMLLFILIFFVFTCADGTYQGGLRWIFKERQYVKSVLLSLICSVAFYILYIIVCLNQCIDVVLMLLYLIILITVPDKENQKGIENYEMFFATWGAQIIIVVAVIVYATALVIGLMQ